MKLLSEHLNTEIYVQGSLDFEGVCLHVFDLHSFGFESEVAFTVLDRVFW